MNPPGNPGIRGCRLPILIRNGVLPGRIKIEISGKNSGRVKSKQGRNIAIGCGNPAVAGIQLVLPDLLKSYVFFHSTTQLFNDPCGT